MEPNFRSQNSPDDWFVGVLVAIMKFWIFFGCAIVKAAIIVMEDPETARVVRILLNHVEEGAVDNAERPSHSPSTSNATVFSLDTDHQRPVLHAQPQLDVSEREFYVITTGLDVGVTERSAVVQTLTIDIPQACHQRFESREDAIEYYLSSVRAGTVHQIRTTTLPTGHIERHSEMLPTDSGIRDLDVFLALGGASVVRELHGLSFGTAQGSHRIPSISGATDSDGIVMPEDWLFTRMPCPASTPESLDGLICPSSTPVSSNASLANPAEVRRVIVISDDEDESETSLQAQDASDALEGVEVSSHSSDQYYTSELDKAIQEVIEEEDRALNANGSD